MTDNRNFTVRVTSNGFVVTQANEDQTVNEWVFESVASLARFFCERTPVQPRRRRRNAKIIKQSQPTMF